MGTDHLRGALFSKIIENQVTNQTIQINKSLQAYGRTYYSIRQVLHRTNDSLKRASLRWPVSIKAMVSIEASLAIPIFLIAFLEIISLLSCLSTYSEMLYKIKETVDPISMYAYAFEALDEEKQNIGLYLKRAINSEIKEASYVGSELNERGEFVAARIQYEAKPIIPFLELDIPLQNYYYLRLWTGYEKDTDENLTDIVYVTRTGTVYHTFRDCSHLMLSIERISKSDINSACNETGEVYVNCPMCLEIVEKEERLDYFYITRTGNKYHGNISCSALKRTVICVTIEEVQGRKLCTRCEKRGNQ